MKKILTIICLSCFLFSCVEDTGNYNYLDVSDVDPVEIKDISKTQEVIINNNLDINPTVTGITNESDYSYVWFVMNVLTQQEFGTGTIWCDTIGREKNLSFNFNYPQGEYKLYYRVRNNKTDVSSNFEMRLLALATDISFGYYILKDEGGYTDFDYIAFDNTKSYRDVLRNVGSGDSRIPGNARKMIEQRFKYSHRFTDEQGVVTLNKTSSAYHILTDRQLESINADNVGEVFKDFNSMFYERPAAGFAVENIAYHKSDRDALFMINAGKLYGLYTDNTNYGLFGPPFRITQSEIPESQLPYDLHQDMIVNQDYAVVFDKNRKKFFHAFALGLNMDEEIVEESYSRPAGTDLELVHMLQGTPNTLFTGITDFISAKAIFKDNNSGDYYYADLLMMLDLYEFIPLVQFYEKLPSTSGLINASVLAAVREGYFIYYADGNRLMAGYDPTVSPTDELVYSFPSDETIAYIKEEAMGADRWSLPEYALTVLTNSASGWHLYVFEMAGNGTPTLGAIKEQYSGTGNAKYLKVRYADE